MVENQNLKLGEGYPPVEVSPDGNILGQVSAIHQPHGISPEATVAPENVSLIVTL